MTRTEILGELGWVEVATPGAVYLIDDLDQVIARYPADVGIDQVQEILRDNMDVVDGGDGRPMPNPVMRAHTMLEEARRKR